MRRAATVSRLCDQGDHGFCHGTRITCGCTQCHLGPCAVCCDDNLLKMYELDGQRMCASCYRAMARRVSARHSQPCDRCRKSGAYRNPVHRRNEYLCSTCHGADDTPLVLTSSVAHLAAPCKGADITDERHDWVHVRGSRFQCVCGIKKYDSVLRAEVRRNLERNLF